MPIVLDAMGSDDHPVPEIAAAIEFAKATGEKVYFVGNKDVIFKHCSESDFAGLPIEIVHAEDILEMGEKAVKSTQAKPNNSMAIGLGLETLCEGVERQQYRCGYVQQSAQTGSDQGCCPSGSNHAFPDKNRSLHRFGYRCQCGLPSGISAAVCHYGLCLCGKDARDQEPEGWPAEQW